MFGDSKSSKTTNNESYSANTIQNGTSVKGEISSSGNIRIDGKLDGTLTTKAKLVVGKTGEIVGDVFCKSANIQGKVHGVVHVEDQLHLQSAAFIDGDIITKKLIVEEGAQFNGSCKMGTGVAKSNLRSSSNNESEPIIQKQAV